MPENREKQEALHLADIRKTYFAGTVAVPVLKGVNYDIWRGEFIGIMGSSGSGKSTMLNILGLLDKPTSGEYRLDGLDVSKMSDYELTRVRNIKIGFVFQAFNLFPHLTVQENIEVPMLYAEIPAKKRHEVSAYMAERVQQQGGQAAYIGLLSACPAANHNSRFDFDEQALANGAAMFTAVTASLLA